MKVLLTETIHASGIQMLVEKGLDVQIAQDTKEATLIREAKDAVGLLVRMAAIPESLINACRSLKIIARHGVGYENIDVATATKRRIPVSITWNANAQSVAEHVITLMLTLAKRIVPYDSAVRSREWAIRNSYSTNGYRRKNTGNRRIRTDRGTSMPESQGGLQHGGPGL